MANNGKEIPELYGEHYFEGGLLRFDGATLDGKAIKKVFVDKTGDVRIALIVYSDRHFYAVGAKHDKGKFDILKFLYDTHEEHDCETLETVWEKWGKLTDEEYEKLFPEEDESEGENDEHS